MFDLSIWRCSPALKEAAERIAVAEGRNAERVAEERKKRNYADFWVRGSLTCRGRRGSFCRHHPTPVSACQIQVAVFCFLS